VKAVCSWFGPSKLEGFDGGGAAAVGAFVRSKEDAVAASPVTHASKDDPPVLMVHGDQDRTVPLSQSEKMLSALEAAGGKGELVVVKGAGHGWRGGEADPSAEAILVKCFEFFDRELRGGGGQQD
jgi:dipeptidyl aminopeptidase/acylaminoacyl peptidase